MCIRDRLIGRDHFHVRVGSEEAADDVLNNFVKQFYSGTPFIPVSYTHLDVYKRQEYYLPESKKLRKQLAGFSAQDMI